MDNNKQLDWHWPALAWCHSLDYISIDSNVSALSLLQQERGQVSKEQIDSQSVSLSIDYEIYRIGWSLKNEKGGYYTLLLMSVCPDLVVNVSNFHCFELWPGRKR